MPFWDKIEEEDIVFEDTCIPVEVLPLLRYTGKLMTL